MKKRMISVMMAAVMGLSLAGCGSKDTAAPADTQAQTTEAEKKTDAQTEETAAAESEEAGTLIVGFDQDFPPMGFLGDDGEYTGFDLELAEEVAKRLGLTYQPQPIAWDAKDMELETGNIDCIWNGFTMNGREDEYTFSVPYVDNSQVIDVYKRQQ